MTKYNDDGFPDVLNSYVMNTGGGCMVRVVEMDDCVLIITDEVIGKYKSIDDFLDDDNDDLCLGYIDITSFKPLPK